MRQQFLTCVTLGFLMMFAACNHRGVIQGHVRDNFGQPLPGANISIANSDFATTSGQNGAFFLFFAPGEFTVAIDKVGYVGTSVHLTVSQGVVFPMATTTLVARPPAAGIFQLSNAGYVPLKTSPVHTTRQQPRLSLKGILEPNRYSVDMPEDALVGPTTAARFAIANVPPGLRLQRVDTTGTLGDDAPSWLESDAAAGVVIIDHELVAVDDFTFLTARIDAGVYCFVPTKTTRLRNTAVEPEQPAWCFIWNIDASNADSASPRVAESAAEGDEVEKTGT